MTIVQQKTHRAYHSMMGLTVFLIINLPSIKLFLGPRPIINVTVLMLLLTGVGIHISQHRPLSIPKTGSILLGGLISIFGLSLFATILETILDTRIITSDLLNDVFGLTYIILIIVAVLIAANVQVTKYYLRFQVGWGLLIAIFYRIGYIQPSIELLQHYNTVTLPIALSILITLAYLLVSKRQKELYSHKLGISTAALIIELLVLLSLAGRSPFFFIPPIVLFVLIFSDLHKFSLYILLKKFIQMLVIFSLLAWSIIKSIELFNISINSFLLYRYETLITAGFANEGRLLFIIPVIQRILENPLGYGFGSYSQIIGGNYPHNLILEVLFTGGWVAGLILTLCLWLVFRQLFRSLHNAPTIENTGIFMVASYLILTFMTSYSFSSDSHLLFTCLTLGIVTQATPLNKKGRFK